MDYRRRIAEMSVQEFKELLAANRKALLKITHDKKVGNTTTGYIRRMNAQKNLLRRNNW